jgi:hypothetical protein
MSTIGANTAWNTKVEVETEKVQSMTRIIAKIAMRYFYDTFMVAISA